MFLQEFLHFFPPERRIKVVVESGLETLGCDLICGVVPVGGRLSDRIHGGHSRDPFGGGVYLNNQLILGNIIMILIC